MIDIKVEKLSSEDLKDKSLEELKFLLKKNQSQKTFFENLQMAVKIFMNSTYGAIANAWFGGHKTEIAEAITLEGQEATKYGVKIINHYFHNIWHKDKKLHQKLKLKNIQKIDESKDIGYYGDTDSVFTSFDEAFRSCEHPYGDDFLNFILDLVNYRLKDYFIKCFDKFREKNNLEDNFLAFDLEKIGKRGIHVAKKKYIIDVVWQDGMEFDSMTKIYPKGLEIVQSSTPIFARKVLNELSKYLLSDNPTEEILVQRLNQYKKEFKVESIENISFGRKANNYNKYVLNDSTQLELAKGIPIHIRAAAIHNHLILNSKHRGRYDLIHSGDFIKYYHVQDNKNKEMYIFGYIPNSYPIEIAPPVNYDLQFEKAIIDPLNRLVEVFKDINVINPELNRLKSLF